MKRLELVGVTPSRISVRKLKSVRRLATGIAVFSSVVLVSSSRSAMAMELPNTLATTQATLKSTGAGDTATDTLEGTDGAAPTTASYAYGVNLGDDKKDPFNEAFHLGGSNDSGGTNTDGKFTLPGDITITPKIGPDGKTIEIEKKVGSLNGEPIIGSVTIDENGHVRIITATVEF